MARAIALLIVGVVAGSALAVLFSGSETMAGREPLNRARDAMPAVASSVESSSLVGATGSDIDLASVVPGDARLATLRLAYYERAAAAIDSAALEPLIETAAAHPDSIERELELEALLARAAELDFAHAARMGESFFLDTRLVAPVYREWAIADAGRALDAVAAIFVPERQQAFALAVLDGVGNSAANTERVAAALPEHARFGFEHEAFLARVMRQPEAAIAELRRGGRDPRLFLASAAEAWARVDPLAALEYAASMKDELSRQEYVGWVYEAWAAAAPEEAIAHLTAPQNAALANTSVLRAVARSAPRRVLEVADALSEGVPYEYELRLSAINVLAGRDVLEALAYVDTMASPGARANLWIAIADDYGRQNPNAALAWAGSLSPPLPRAREAVIAGIADNDPDHALDLALADIVSGTFGGGTLSPPAFMSRMITSERGDPVRLMSRLVDTPNARNLLNQSLSLWTRIDPDAATAWAFANLDRLDQAALGQMAADFARSRPADAERVLASLPPERRGSWLAAMAGVIVRSNPNDAVAFVERYRGQPGYEQGFNAALRAVARADPRRAVRLLADAGRVPAGETLMLIAGSWVRLDPEAAGDWALGLADGEQRMRAARAVAASWAERGTGARDWVLGLPRGALRDAALDALLFAERSPATAAGTLSPTLLEAYSSDAARERGVSRAAVMIGRRDADAARLLLGAHVSDPEIRKQTEELLAQPDARNTIYIEYFGAN